MFGKFIKLLLEWMRGRFLPCYVFSRKPMIFASYDTDFLNNLDGFTKALTKYDSAYLLLQLGWQRQDSRTASPFIEEIKAAQKRIPQLKILVLANSPTEADTLKNGGLDALYCHQNAFLNESIYKLYDKENIVFDAIYIARITRFKRHFLAKNIKSLKLIGCFSNNEKEYAAEVLNSLAPAEYVEKVFSRNISKNISQASCGLCLSSEEGAMFVCAEYLLSGRPIVNTHNIGGRDMMIPAFAEKKVDDSPEAIAQAVNEWRNSSLDSAKIREATLELMRPEREKLRKIINDIFLKEHEKHKNYSLKFKGKFPHKLGLRCFRTPLSNLLHGILR